MSKSLHARSAFTLVEILIVVVILSILAVVAIPKFSNASQIARQSTLQDDLRFLRSQSAVYSAQHNDVPPGYPGGDSTATPTHETFVAQMTRATNISGIVDGNGQLYGPYLSQMPENPVNNKQTIKILAANDPFESDDNYGWLYKPSMKQFRAANAGLDSQGKSFLDY